MRNLTAHSGVYKFSKILISNLSSHFIIGSKYHHLFSFKMTASTSSFGGKKICQLPKSEEPQCVYRGLFQEKMGFHEKKEMASSAPNSNNYTSGFPHDAHHTLACKRNTLCVLSFHPTKQ